MKKHITHFLGFVLEKRVPWCLAFLLMLSISIKGQNITANFTGATVEQCLEQLKDQNGYSFAYKTQDVNLKAKVNAKIQSQPIEEVLNIIFKGQKVTYQIDGKMVRITKSGTVLDSQQAPQQGNQQGAKKRTISGTVVDSNSEPLIGVSVAIKGTTQGTMTDISGKYNLQVSDNDNLEFTYVGYDPSTVKVGSSNVYNLTMREKENSLDAVVVIGYGVSKKSDLTGAVASVKTDDMSFAASSSIGQMLAGKAAGMTVTQNSAQPGGGIEILIRGATSTGASNAPLYVVDGFPLSDVSAEPSSNNRYSDFGSRSPLNSINPNDIESIEILKDASSTAIYGARAASGVVLITTKKGKEGRAVVNYSASYGVQRIANKIEMMTANQFMNEANKYAVENWRYTNGIYPYGTIAESSVTRPSNLEPYTQAQISEVGRGTDWYDLITQDGMINQHNVSVSGGTDKLKYLASFNFFDQNGVVKNSDFTRYTGRFNIEHKINKMFTFGINSTYSQIRSSNIPLGKEDHENAGLINSALSYDPTIPVKDENGNYVISPKMTTVPNPVSMLEITDYTTSKQLLVNTFVQAEVIKNLFLKANIGLQDQNAIRNAYLPKTTLYGAQAGGSASKSMATVKDKLFEFTANYLFEINKIHKFNLLAGYSGQEIINEGFTAASSDFFTDQFGFNNLGAGSVARPTVGSNKAKTVYQSFFGRINYNLMDKYLLTVSMRADGSSKFGENNRYGYFPSSALAWRIKQEDFLQNTEWLSDLKLRLGYGQTGNSSISQSAYEYWGYNWKDYVFGDAVNIGTSRMQLANPDLKWETTTEFNIGLDFGLFNQRLSGSIDYYHKEVKDQLGIKKLKSFMDIKEVVANIGVTQGTGLEISLHSINLTGPVRWTSDFSFTRYRDKWKERNPDNELSPWQKNDDPLRAQYGYLSDGILQIGETPPASMPDLKPGQFKVKDTNGYKKDANGNYITDANGKVQYTGEPDGIIDQADIVYLGTTDPGFSMGLGNTVEYKGFDLNIYFYGMFDRIVNNETRGKFSTPEIRRILTGQNLMTEVMDRWSLDNPSSSIPSGFINSNYVQPSNYLWEDAWFIRCKNITLGYTLPKSITKNVLSKARIFADLSNPFVITPYSGNDPETDFKAGYPNQRSLMFGVDITF